jgi:hypothetical protein
MNRRAASLPSLRVAAVCSANSNCSRSAARLGGFPFAALQLALDGIADEIGAVFEPAIAFLKNGVDSLSRSGWEFHQPLFVEELLAPHARRNTRFRLLCHQCHSAENVYTFSCDDQRNKVYIFSQAAITPIRGTSG